MVYRIGWLWRGKWKYITVKTHEDAMMELWDKTTISDKVSFRAIPDNK